MSNSDRSFCKHIFTHTIYENQTPNIFLRQEHKLSMSLLSFSAFAFDKVLSFDSAYLDPSVQCKKIRKKMTSILDTLCYYLFRRWKFPNHNFVQIINVDGRDFEIFEAFGRSMIFWSVCVEKDKNPLSYHTFEWHFISANNISTLNSFNRI